MTVAGEGTREPRGSGVSGCPEAKDKPPLAIKNALLSQALAAALAEDRGLGRGSSERHTGWVHRVRAIGMGSSPA